MRLPDRPHVLGIDDGPFEKHVAGARAPIVGVMMEGHDLVEAVAITEFPVDGGGVTAFLAEWIRARRFAPTLDGLLFGGITLAGLAVLDPAALARELGAPVVVVNRKERSDAPLRSALAKAGLADRAALLDSAPASLELPGGIYAGIAGGPHDLAAALIARTRAKSELPEPLRLAHLFAHALVRGESRGRP
ncbi:MAG TPA: DUF99 family protein [Myxococcota bacterium]|nr:DUF99 family protein [Myxococcota bacterium]